MQVSLDLPANKATNKDVVALAQKLLTDCRIDQLGDLGRWAAKKSPAELQAAMDTLIDKLDFV